jgi:hypothetical protein
MPEICAAFFAANPPTAMTSAISESFASERESAFGYLRFSAEYVRRYRSGGVLEERIMKSNSSSGFRLLPSVGRP